MERARILADGIAWPESPRWHEGRLWFTDGRRLVRALHPDGRVSDVVEVPGTPSGLGWTPDGDLLVVSMDERRLMRLDAQSTRSSVHGDLSGMARHLNDLVVLPDGRAFVGDSGFVWGREDPALGRILTVAPSGEARVVAEGLAMPNGLAITPDASELIVAETLGGRLSRFSIGPGGELGPRRTVHAFDDLGWVPDLAALWHRPVAPDGICLNADGAVWVGNPLRAVVCCMTREGEVIDQVGVSQPGIACMLGGPDRRTLFITTGLVGDDSGRAGRIEACDVEVPGAGFP